MVKELTDIQNELKAPKSRFNKFGGYNYRSCEDIQEAAKPILKKYGCNLTLSDDIIEVAGRIYVKATATLSNGTDTEQVTAMARESETKKGMDDSQITGTASSYARKYALNGLFLLDDTKDADTDEYAEQTAGRKKSTEKVTVFIGKNEMESITKEMERTGITEKTILGFCKISKMSDMTMDDYAAVMQTFKNTKNKEA